MLSDRYSRDSAEFGRSLGFFDAVYGFALTFLIANVDLPPPDQWQSLDALLSGHVGPQLVGFLISFVVIVVFWRSNQQLIGSLTGLDSTTITLNIVLTGLVVFIPFTTQAISDPGMIDLSLPTIVYAINVALAILVQVVMYQRALSRGLVKEPVPAELRRAQLVDVLINPAVFLASIPVALAFGGIAAKWTWLLMLVAGPISGRRVASVARAVEAGAD